VERDVSAAVMSVMFLMTVISVLFWTTLMPVMALPG
jgi:hypothetical protein